MALLPSHELIRILRPAYAPCPGFRDTCATHARWGPTLGHVPRGFAGAIGALKEVEIVILVAEPGNPHFVERYPAGLSADDLLERAHGYVLNCLAEGRDLFHRNLRFLLDLIHPRDELSQQLRRVWITETYLCSARVEGGSVGTKAETGCAQRYLLPQLQLLQDRPVIALGNKAYRRAKRHASDSIPQIISAWSVAPPGCNKPEAKDSWRKAAALAQSKRRSPQEH